MWVLCGQFKEPLQSLGRPKFHLRQHCSIHTYMHSAGDRRQGQNMWLGRWYVKGILLKYPMLEPVLKLTWMTVAPCVSEKMSDPDIWQGDCRHNAHLLPSFHHLPSSHCKQPPLWLPHQVQVKSGKSSLRVWLCLLPGLRRIMKMKEDIFLVKMNSPAPAPTFSSPLLARLLVSNLKAWEFMSGDKKITQEQIRVPSGGKARNTVNDQSTVVLLQVFSISLNNQLTLVGW